MPGESKPPLLHTRRRLLFVCFHSFDILKWNRHHRPLPFPHYQRERLGDLSMCYSKQNCEIRCVFTLDITRDVEKNYEKLE